MFTRILVYSRVMRQLKAESQVLHFSVKDTLLGHQSATSSKFIQELDTILETPSFLEPRSTSISFKTPGKKNFFSPWKKPDKSPNLSQAFESPEKPRDVYLKSDGTSILKASSPLHSKLHLSQTEDYIHRTAPNISGIFTMQSSLSYSSSISSPRCSTPIQRRMSRKLVEDDLDISVISVCQSNTRLKNSERLHSNSTFTSVKKVKIQNPEEIDFIEKRSGSNFVLDVHLAKNLKEKKKIHARVDKIRNSSTTESHSSDPSFVTRVFFSTNHQMSNINNPVELIINNEIPVSRKNVMRKKEKQCCSSKFPKFAPFCNKKFYVFLRNKMESKYRLKTNREVVRVAKYISECVNDVSSENNSQDVADALKISLFRKQVIKTHLDFFFFCIRFLPSCFVRKVVPMIQPSGVQSIKFNWNLMCNSIE